MFKKAMFSLALTSFVKMNEKYVLYKNKILNLVYLLSYTNNMFLNRLCTKLKFYVMHKYPENEN